MAADLWARCISVVEHPQCKPNSEIKDAGTDENTDVSKKKKIVGGGKREESEGQGS